MHVHFRTFAASKLSHSGAQSHPIRGLPFGTAQRSCLFHQLLHFNGRVTANLASKQAPRHRWACRRDRAKPRAAATAFSGAPAQQHGHEGGDAAHWNFSPEWWGTQDGGWGHDAGKTVFRRRSERGNGEASLHAARAQARVDSTEYKPPAEKPVHSLLRRPSATSRTTTQLTLKLVVADLPCQ